MMPGTKVKMSEGLKAQLRGKCGEAGHHLGPFDSEADLFDPEVPNDNDCWGCSSAHADEFCNSVGIVSGLTDYNNCNPGDPDYDADKVGPEVDVYWQPDNLRYCYHPNQLVVVDE